MKFAHAGHYLMAFEFSVGCLSEMPYRSPNRKSVIDCSPMGSHDGLPYLRFLASPLSRSIFSWDMMSSVNKDSSLKC
jgi:hypothetical protein